MKFLLWSLGWVLCLSVFAGEDKTEKSNEKDTDKSFYEHISYFTHALNLIQKLYIEEVKVEKLLEGAMEGMLSTLDPHSSYLSPTVFQELQTETSGKFAGVGLELSRKEGKFVVVAPISESPADRAGVKSGDELFKVDEHLLNESSIDDLMILLRGKKGTSVKIGLRRMKANNQIESFEVVLTREIIRLKSVKFVLINREIAYLHISSFQENTFSEFSEALSNMDGKNKRIKYMVVDLRNNPGGLFDQAVKIADLFIEQGVIVSTIGRDPETKEVVMAKTPGTFRKLPLAILVNEGTASAAEIVSGAIQDHKLGFIMGTQTFGKGSVQQIIPLINKAGIKITVAKYYTPANRSIQALGIVPDIIIEALSSERKSAHEGGIKEADLHNHFLAVKEKKDQNKEEIDIENIDDNQLSEAIQILKSTSRIYSVSQTDPQK